MDKLNLPSIKGPVPAAKSLSMEEYLEFVTQNLKYTFDRKAHENWKKLSGVNVPFKIKTA
ncbi:MAG: hypothetical protein ABIA63_13520 [bacterium]